MVNNSSRCFGFLASLGFRSWSVEDIARCLSGFGYSAVEWTLAHFSPQKSPDELTDLVRIPEQYGLVVSGVVVQQDFVTLDQNAYKNRVELVAACIPAAAQAGINVLNLFTGPAPWDPKAPRFGIDISEGLAWELILATFQRLVPLAERHHVYLAVEAVFGHLCHDYYTLQELLHHFDSEYLAVNLDPSHYQLYGNDVPWTVQRLARRIRHVHLKDAGWTTGAAGERIYIPFNG